MTLSLITRPINAIGDLTATVLQSGNVGHILGSAILGGVAGPFTSMGWQVGMFQGAMQGVIHGLVIRPIGTFVKSHSGKQPDQFNDNAKYMLLTTLAVAGFVLPILIASKSGVSSMNKFSSVMPGFIGKYLKPSETAVHKISSAVFLSVIPACISFAIGFGEEAKKIRP